MKYFAIILAFFTIVLSAIPCDDEAALNDSAIVVITDAHDDDLDFHLDMCTPFDSCDCCATPISVPDIFIAAFDTENISSKLNVDYTSSFSNDFINNIFQPPRI